MMSTEGIIKMLNDTKLSRFMPCKLHSSEPGDLK